MDDLADFWVHITTIERLIGAGPEGDALDEPANLIGFVDPVVRLVRDPNGVEVVSSATVYYPADAAFISPGSYITPPASLGGRRARVLTCAVRDSGSLDLPDHMEVTVE